LTLVILLIKLPAFIRRSLSMFCSSFICVISLISLYSYFYLLFTGHESPVTQLSFLSFILSPVRVMAFLTACNFLLIGCVLLLLSAEKEKASNIAHLLAIPVFLISYFIISSYILEVYSAT
jgi:hypothetical protein